MRKASKILGKCIICTLCSSFIHFVKSVNVLWTRYLKIRPETLRLKISGNQKQTNPKYEMKQTIIWEIIMKYSNGNDRNIILTLYCLNIRRIKHLVSFSRFFLLNEGIKSLSQTQLERISFLMVQFSRDLVDFVNTVSFSHCAPYVPLFSLRSFLIRNYHSVFGITHCVSKSFYTLPIIIFANRTNYIIHFFAGWLYLGNGNMRRWKQSMNVL